MDLGCYTERVKHILRDTRGLATIWVVLITLLLTAGATGGGTYYLVHRSSQNQLDEKDQKIRSLEDKVSEAQAPATASPGGAPGTTGGQANTQVVYQSANTGISVTVPEEWAGQWRYAEKSNEGISTSSVTFYLINKDTKYQPVVTIGKIPQAKYDDAKATGSPIGGDDNYLGAANGFVYAMAFEDGSAGDYKNFSYADAVKAVRAAFKASFKTI